MEGKNINSCKAAQIDCECKLNKGEAPLIDHEWKLNKSRASLINSEWKLNKSEAPLIDHEWKLNKSRASLINSKWELNKSGSPLIDREPTLNNSKTPIISKIPEVAYSTQSAKLVPLTDLGSTPVTTGAAINRIKVPVVLAEPTLQLVVESSIDLHPSAIEIKRVKKNVFLNKVKLIPAAYTRIGSTDFFNVKKAKLFIEGHIRENIEYSSQENNDKLQDRIADILFTGFVDITAFINPPIIGLGESAEANFLNETTHLDAHLSEYFSQDLIKYNKQPYGELVAANIFELDVSPKMVSPDGDFRTLWEKIVLDLTLTILQVQQITFTSGIATAVVPTLTGLTHPISPPETS